MKIKCDWCGSWINDFDQVCPNCGGVNNNYNRHANGVPQTIEELKAWAKEMNLPLEDMRTFIGEDYKGAKAFGIYKDETDGTFVVYKNKRTVPGQYVTREPMKPMRSTNFTRR